MDTNRRRKIKTSITIPVPSTKMPFFVMFIYLWLSMLFGLSITMSPTMATNTVPCNFCGDTKTVTKPKAKFTVFQAFGIVPVEVTCGYWDYLMKSGVTEARCVYNQNDEYRQLKCGCA
jgi:hypothetical protein